ncbi:MAG: hypothetical protein JWQ33_851 [Ramlibacter sp.]|nr:hypothetical protein [Ramlibacter sp.]
MKRVIVATLTVLAAAAPVQIVRESGATAE